MKTPLGRTLIITFLCCTYSSIQGYSQIPGGTISFSGDFNVDYSKESVSSSDEFNENLSLQFLPGVGFFISKDLSIGINFGVEYNKSINHENFTEVSNNIPYIHFIEVDRQNNVFVVQPNLAVYHFFNDKIGIKNNFIIGFGFGSGKINYTDVYFHLDQDIFQFEAAYDLRLVFLPKKNIAVNLSIIGLNYSHEKNDYHSYIETDNHFQFNSLLNQSVSLGVEFYFGMKSTNDSTK